MEAEFQTLSDLAPAISADREAVELRPSALVYCRDDLAL